jgi:probable RNA-binding protein EIF1AD
MPRPKRDVLASAEAASSPPSTLPSNHLIARVIKAQGNNLFSVSLPSGEELLVELASRLRNTFWIKRRGYVIVDTEALAERDNKLGGEIVTVIMSEREWRKMSYWPKEFAKHNTYDGDDDEDDEEEEESNVGKMPPSDSEDEEDDSH